MKARMLASMVMLATSVGVVAHSCSPSGDHVDAPEGAATTTASTDATIRTTRAPVQAEVTIAEPSESSRAAEDTARDGLTVAFTWFPATDATQNEAYGRARNWLTDELAARMIIEATTERGPGVQWTQWAQQQSKVVAEVSIECSGCPTDTDSIVRRVATIKQTAITGDNTATVVPDTTLWVTIVREGDRWLIDDIRY